MTYTFVALCLMPILEKHRILVMSFKAKAWFCRHTLTLSLLKTLNRIYITNQPKISKFQIFRTSPLLNHTFVFIEYTCNRFGGPPTSTERRWQFRYGDELVEEMAVEETATSGKEVTIGGGESLTSYECGGCIFFCIDINCKSFFYLITEISFGIGTLLNQ